MKKTVALIYEYYKSQKTLLPYLKTILTTWGIILIHINIINEIFNITDFITGTYKYENYLSLPNLYYTGFSVFILLILFFLFRKKDIVKYELDKTQLSKNLRRLILYCSVMFIILILSFYFSPLSVFLPFRKPTLIPVTAA